MVMRREKVSVLPWKFWPRKRRENGLEMWRGRFGSDSWFRIHRLAVPCPPAWHGWRQVEVGQFLAKGVAELGC